MPPERSLDIDTPRDLHIADLLLRDALVAGPAASSPNPSVHPGV
jgi:hypothetical protein